MARGARSGVAADAVASADELAKAVRHAISEGEFPPHLPLPSYRQLGSRFGVSTRIVGNAFDLLEKEGILYRQERRGTFIRAGALAVEEAPGRISLPCINIVVRHRIVRSAHAPYVLGGYLAGYTQALEHRHVKTRFVVHSQDEESLEGILAQEYALSDQGCILVGLLNASLMRRLRERRIPFVVQHYVRYATDGLPGHHRVFANKTGGAFQATQHLLALGHRRVGFMGWRPESGYETRVYEGYCAALRCAGSEPSSDDVFDFATDEARLAVGPAREFLSRRPRPTAILAQTDSGAIGLLEAARDLRIRVPEELSVIGFNDQPEAALSAPPLTTVSVPFRRHGRTAAQMLMKAAEGAYDSWQTKILECHLVRRKTTAVRLARAS